MKKVIINIMATTGITLIVLAIIGALYGANFIFIIGVFHALATNIIVHSGYLLTRKFESKYIALEVVLDLGFTIFVVVFLGTVIKWFNNTPVGILVIMAVVIYLIGLLLSIFGIRKEINTINRLLQNRNKKNKEI